MNISKQTLFILLVINSLIPLGLIGQANLNITLSKISWISLNESLDTLQDLSNKIIYQLPQENKVVYYKDIYLQWENTYDNPDCRLQISTNKTFLSLVLDTILKANHIVISALDRHKDYYWRVSNVWDNETYSGNFSFFKTTSIHLDESQNFASLEVIPTWIDNAEVLFIHNPDLLNYNIQVTDEKDVIRLRKDCNHVNYAFVTESWPRGSYNLTLLLSNNHVQTKSFFLR